MKLIIDIDEEVYKGLIDDPHVFVKPIFDAIKNCTPIPDNATNGEVIKAMFPQWKLMENTFEEMVMFDIPMKDGYLEHNACSRDWWNAPYQKGGKE